MNEYALVARGKQMFVFFRLHEIWREHPDAVITVSDPKGEVPTRTVPVKDLLLDYVRTLGRAQ